MESLIYSLNATIPVFDVMASPLALVTIGAGFEGKKALAKIKPTLAASFVKLIVQAALFLPLASYFGFRDQKLIALIIMLGSPTTVSCYIMAKNMNNDGVLTSSIVVATTLLSAVTLTMWIFILKNWDLLYKNYKTKCFSIFSFPMFFLYMQVSQLQLKTYILKYCEV